MAKHKAAPPSDHVDVNDRKVRYEPEIKIPKTSSSSGAAAKQWSEDE